MNCTLIESDFDIIHLPDTHEHTHTQAHTHLVVINFLSLSALTCRHFVSPGPAAVQVCVLFTV